MELEAITVYTAEVFGELRRNPTSWVGVKELQKRTGKTAKAISKHTRMLRAFGVVEVTRAGKHHLYRVAPDAPPEVVDRLGIVAEALL